tara:strand:+ start:262 stop:1350 length:1089 start_codon:yes stop_codon:yes gene_type:complete
MTFEPNPVTTEQLVEYLTKKVGSDIGCNDIREAGQTLSISYATACKRLKNYKTGIGKWNLTAQAIEKAYQAPSAQPAVEASYVPSKDETFTKFGSFDSIQKIIKSKLFYPAFITGLSGNGKTLCVEQACAVQKREMIRVNITIETDEDDLIGGFRLIDGSTVWHNGPVVEALERGAILLLDEIDLASNKILCLQSVLEGKGVFLKKIGKYVRPAAGFNVIATANTKGKGSDDGRFVGTNVLNEAFLERFPVTFEQEYPTATVETKILLANGCDKEFTELLVKWAGIIRKTFYDGGVDEVVTTRRLVHIAKAFAIFGNRLTAVTNCISRFDEDTKQSFLDLYTKVDAGEDMEDDQEPDGDVSF